MNEANTYNVHGSLHEILNVYRVNQYKILFHKMLLFELKTNKINHWNNNIIRNIVDIPLYFFKRA